jgi:hypothetical protein
MKTLQDYINELREQEQTTLIDDIVDRFDDRVEDRFDTFFDSLYDNEEPIDE